MKTLYSKLIVGFLVSIIVSFSFAGYFGLKNHSDQMEELAISRLQSVAVALKEEIAFYDLEVLDNLADAASVGIILIPKSGGDVIVLGNDITDVDIKHIDKLHFKNQFQRVGTSYIHMTDISDNYYAYIK